MDNSKVTVTLYIARHGECSGNAAQKFQDPMTDQLTSVGRAQAELLGRHLKDVPFTGAFASDYPRAEETARTVLRESNAKENGVELKIDVRLRERDYTGIIGVAAKDAVKIMYSAMHKGTPYLEVEMQNCETVQQFETRIVSFFSELFENLRKSSRQHETILVVSHGLTIQRLIVLLNNSPSSFGVSKWNISRFSERQMRNTTYHKLSLEIPKGSSAGVTGYVESAHCRDHIENGCSNGHSATNGQATNVKDGRNYSFLEQASKGTSFEEETVQYCVPV